ncbi:hypothetical protein [Streptomyces malaysiensis]|uniref:hypothetical protein n=1 Tax=Streptomyces malaysiensis TaxID=92644 RepID=UPI00142EC681|nr:hypothetical protein [Streptomyces malaysiensis]
MRTRFIDSGATRTRERGSGRAGAEVWTGEEAPGALPDAEARRRAGRQRRSGEQAPASAAKKALSQRQRMEAVRPKSTTRRRVSVALVARHTTGPAADGPDPVR